MRENYYQQKHLRGYVYIEDELKAFLHCKRILDVGCGTGWFCEALREAYPHAEIIGVDIYNAVEFKGFDWLIASCTNLPFQSETFEGVACKSVLEHLYTPLETVIELNRIMREGGTLFVSVPDVRDRQFWDDYSHVRPYSVTSITTLLKDGGFEVSELWWTGSIPGVGVLMRALKTKNQRFLKLCGKIGPLRKSICIISKKI
jgi:ubiquinone/menaquinone biosynthesis C-methylase UbiE